MWIGAAEQSGPDRKALGSLFRSQVLLWAWVGGGLGTPPRTALSRQPSAGHLGALHALLNWTLESLCTLTPTPHLGGLGPPHPVPAPASQELARLQVGEGVWGHSRARGQWAAWVGEVSPVLHGILQVFLDFLLLHSSPL